jgi:radical SAM superfamily enzyme YgiQ (UPF0313 family)
MRLYFFQCQESYGNNIYLPYSSGILWAYVSQFTDITDNFELVDIFFEKIEIQTYIDKLDNPDILLFSNYGWNTTYHCEIARRAKEKFPNVKIIIGGPNAQQSEKYLTEHSYVDISVWGEGEQSLLELLRVLYQSNDLRKVPGIAYIDTMYHKNDIRNRQTDITTIPSPYLTGVFDSFFNRYEYNFMPVWETNRGCPYHCTFCDLGADYYNKLYEFDTERLTNEIHWFSKNKIEYVEIADANFGILPRDLELVKLIKHLHDTTGYPQKINATWAKNSPDRVFEASKILDSINRGGVTLALQSQNKNALDNIKRINIANDRLENIAKKYIDSGIQTYHDFILGLPGETLDSWKEGLLYVININPEGWIFGHPLEAYENTEFSDIEYIAKHNLKFTNTPQVSFFAHRKKDIPVEMGKYVISHSSMSKEDYVEAFLFKWFLITVHSLGWANLTAKRVSKQVNIKLGDFYLDFYNYMLNTNGILNTEYNITKQSLLRTLNDGEFWGRQMFGDNDLYWEYESASSIGIQRNRQMYFNELLEFVETTYNINAKEIIDKNNKQCIDFVNDKKQTFVDFCEQIYWKGRRIRKWKITDE